VYEYFNKCYPRERRHKTRRSTILRRLLGLPRLPVEHIRPMFDRIRAFAGAQGFGLEPGMERLFSYFDRQWLTRVGPELLSVNGNPRVTNNDQEAYWRGLYRIPIFYSRHPAAWSFLRELHTVIFCHCCCCLMLMQLT